MNDIDKEEITNLDEDWFMPVSNEWKKCLLFVKDYCFANFNEVKAANILQKATNMVSILVNHGNVTENVVLKTAIIYSFVQQTNYSLAKIKADFSKPVYEGVCELLNTDQKEKPSYLKSIFTNIKYSYLDKIKLCEYINLVINKQNDSSNFLNIKTKAEIELVLKKYSNTSYKKLCSLLREKLSENKI